MYLLEPLFEISALAEVQTGLCSCMVQYDRFSYVSTKLQYWNETEVLLFEAYPGLSFVPLKQLKEDIVYVVVKSWI